MDFAAKRAAFEHWFGLSGAQASLLCLLYNAQGAFLTTNQIAVLESSTADTVMIRISRLRQAMDCEAVDSERGSGYRLSDIGLTECRSALTQMAQSLAAE